MFKTKPLKPGCSTHWQYVHWKFKDPTRLPSNLRHDQTRMRAFSYACSVHFRSRDKDAGYTIRSAVPENAMLHANITALIERKLLPIEVLHCGSRNFRPFWLLWPWPWPHNLHIRTWPVVRGDIPYVQIRTSYTPRLSKVIVWQTYRHTYIETDRQTDRIKMIYPHRFAGGQQVANTSQEAG